jgi:hypothetical protein
MVILLPLFTIEANLAKATAAEERSEPESFFGDIVMK